LTAFALVAYASQSIFQVYYDNVMPYLKAMLLNCTDKSNRMLHAKSMECISLVGMAVGKEKFGQDAKCWLMCGLIVWLWFSMLSNYHIWTPADDISKTVQAMHSLKVAIVLVSFFFCLMDG